MNPQLTLAQGQELYAQFRSRREKWGREETELDSFLVVIFNYGDGTTAVACTAGEWSGTKADLVPRDGIPLCPNGHPLVEGRLRYRLGLVSEVPT